MLSPERRYQQVRVKSRILAARRMRQFMQRQIGGLPCSGDQERTFLIQEFERLQSHICDQHSALQECIRHLESSERWQDRHGTAIVHARKAVKSAL